ncbi:MAG TPA: hypothetical protein VN903_14265 [Polyangia bacterium]|nr:hypothetical protein [Polyangia bacterium]
MILMPHRPTPSDSHPAIHERGLFREDDTFPGQIAFRIYHCQGKLMAMVLIDTEEWFEEDIEDRMRAYLDLRCPPEGCSGDHRRKKSPHDGLHLV